MESGRIYLSKCRIAGNNMFEIRYKGGYIMKKIGFFALIFALVASLTACRGGNTNETTNPSQNSTPAATTAPKTTTPPTTLPMVVDPTILDPTLDTNIPDPNTNNGTDDMGDMFTENNHGNAGKNRMR